MQRRRARFQRGLATRLSFDLLSCGRHRLPRAAARARARALALNIVAGFTRRRSDRRHQSRARLPRCPIAVDARALRRRPTFSASDRHSRRFFSALLLKALAIREELLVVLLVVIAPLLQLLDRLVHEALISSPTFRGRNDASRFRRRRSSQTLLKPPLHVSRRLVSGLFFERAHAPRVLRAHPARFLLALPSPLAQVRWW